LRKLLPLLVIAGTLGFAVPATLAQDQPDQIDQAAIAKMDLKQLSGLIATMTASIGQDTLKLQPAAKKGDCLELTRAANSFALGYRMLADIDASLNGKPTKDALPVKSAVVQSRVITFAARVRAAEWLSGRCASFVAPADKADDPRYAKPAKIQTAEYTQAVIEARQVAEANLAAAIAAGISKSCPATFNSLDAIQLLVPYLDKLAKDVGKRPEALGPKASKRGLELARAKLVNAGNKLYREIGIGCSRAPTQTGEAGAATPPADPAPAPAPAQ
jgi:hypothetical protein